MAVRAAAIVLCASVLSWAPMQCASDPEPGMHREETPGEALYGLANQFKAKGDRDAWRDTLRYLVARYPNSRFAKMAKQDLAEQGEGEGKGEGEGSGAGEGKGTGAGAGSGEGAGEGTGAGAGEGEGKGERAATAGQGADAPR